MATTIAHANKIGSRAIFPIEMAPFWKDLPPELFGKYNNTIVYQEPHFHYAEIPFRDNLDLHGYFQSEKYFVDSSAEIQELFAPKINEEYVDCTAIHVRRTDYLLHSGCYAILTMENYYRKAMELCNSEKYIIFSDDLNWCRKHFVGAQYEFSYERDPSKDLYNIASCSNQIIANSSFSWWGAWLNPNPDKIVVAPGNWFGPKLAPTHNTKDLIPNGWIKING